MIVIAVIVILGCMAYIESPGSFMYSSAGTVPCEGRS